MKKLYGVIGDPIAQSMSPFIHNEWFNTYKIDAYYHPFHITEEDLKDAITGFRAFGIGGFNVTVPHKLNIIPLLDEIDPLAKAIGAVNTVVCEKGKLIGYNTDGEGLLMGLKKKLSNLPEKKVLIVGAGGAARAIYFTLAKEGVQLIDLANRTVSKAKQLISECPFDVKSSALTLHESEERLHEYDLIIQTTSIGMLPKIDESPISLEHLKQGAFVCDIIYNPLETKFLKEAKQKGAIIDNGIDMLLYQGALAFEKWTGVLPSTDKMKQNIEEQLGG